MVLKMRLNIVIGGKAGQGINKVSEIVSQTLTNQGYFTFNYRDYPSIIRGGHNFNILSISDKKIESHESKLDGIVAMDDNTIKVHEKALKKDSFVIKPDNFLEFGRNLNVALAGALIKILGIDKKILIEEIKEQLNNPESLKAAEKGYESQTKKFDLKKLNNKITILSGSKAVTQGAINSGIDIYFAYPMTPATPVLHELASEQLKHNCLVFQNENEIAVANAALGASFSGAKVMVGTSGGGYDLMTEALSLQGMTEIPLVVYLASRAGPATGIPTYTMQNDLGIALYGGHGEFPRVVIAPGNPIEAIEITNHAFYLAEKFNTASIILSDKHLAESEFSSEEKPSKPLKIKIERPIPGEKKVVKASSYESDKYGYSTEDPFLAKKNADERIKRYEEIKKECKKFEMIKFHGKKDSKNLIIGWGSTSGAIKDAIQDLDAKFLQVLYLKPLSDEIKEQMQKAKKIILVEGNVTGQLGRLLREKTGISIKNRILKYDGRPFRSDELKEEIREVLE
ncbi:MAG: 2-oxoacid:acceptor oxidoreductase family protein [Nanoarchaeota archaeon]|nr:2-oxoacid:acceptor oxidoreductase family protein [Nanoarchaeota archaeon]MBU1052145.1 2-oxoacid:acceptor oxidoreductase family protein [Nanoarchaeota archaeon]